MKKILVTGGAGFIGSCLCLKLVEEGWAVTVLDNLSEQIHGQADQSTLYNAIKDKVLFIKGDVRRREDWRLALAGQDMVVHLAAETGTGQSMYEIEKYIDVNVRGTALMLDILANEKYSIQKIIVASSRAIYGEGKYYCTEHDDVYPNARLDDDMQRGDFNVKCPVCRKNAELRPTDEDTRCSPSSIYAISKRTQEEMVLTTGRSLSIPSLALRYQNVYGPGQSLSNPYTGILSIFSTRMRLNKPINIFEDGLESRDFVYIDDVVAATATGLETSRADYRAINIGSGTATTVLTVAEKLKSLLESKSNIEIGGHYRLGDIRHNVADISLAKELLNFEPHYNFDTGIAEFVKWVKTQSLAEDKYDKSIEELKETGLYK